MHRFKFKETMEAFEAVHQAQEDTLGVLIEGVET